MKPLIAIVAALITPGLACAQPSDATSQSSRATITTPNWLRKPTGDDLAANYPNIAISKKVEGRATIKCAVKTDGTLDQCQVINDSPQRFGFGAAALRLAKYFKMTPTGGGGTVIIPISWKLYVGKERPGVVADSVPWVSTPTKEDVIAAFPSIASGQDNRGLVTLLCSVAKDGSLAGCRTLEVQPAAEGFEKAALALAGKFKADAGWRAEPAIDIDVLVEVPIQFAKADDPIWSSPDLGKIVWLKAATPEQVRSVFPAEALKAGVSTGSATVDCVVAKGGALSACTEQSASPEKLGFGQAAAQIAPQFVMNPWTDTGLPAEGASVKMPIKMVYDQKSAEPASPAPTPSTKP